MHIYPSLMLLPVEKLAEETKLMAATSIKGFHLDLMDGLFVNNIGMSFGDLEVVFKNSGDKELDIHLMMAYPVNVLSAIIERIIQYNCQQRTTISFHAECDPHNHGVLIDQLKRHHIKTGMAFNPLSPIEAYIREFGFSLDRYVMMTVNPGFSGAVQQSYTFEKILLLNEQDRAKILLDGSIRMEQTSELSKQGLIHTVLGSAFFSHRNEKDANPYQAIANFYQAI